MRMIDHPLGSRGRFMKRGLGPAGEDIGFTYRRIIGDYIAQRRNQLGMTQTELGIALDIGNNAISGIELGRNPIPPERYKMLIKALQLDPVEFGEFILEHTNPWLFALIYGDRRAAKHHLDDLPSRVASRR